MTQGRRPALRLRCKDVREDMVGDLPSLGDAGRLVERPVNTKVNSALPVLFFRLGQ